MRRSRVKDSRLTETSLKISVLIGGLLLLTGACHNPIKDNITSGDSFGNIIYETFIINRDSTDSWGDETLAGFKREKLIEEVFEAVYTNKIVPTDYFSGEIIPLTQLRKMENEGEFSRKNISKIQFDERWIWDREKSELRKQIFSMTIAYEVYDNTGKSRGQKPIFKLIFRKK